MTAAKKMPISAEAKTDSSDKRLFLNVAADDAQQISNPHRTLTKLCMAMTEEESGNLIGDLLQRFPRLRQTLTATPIETKSS